MADEAAESHEIKEENAAETKAKINYPLSVLYCGVCTMPIEYCEFSPESEKCKEWLKTNYPEVFEDLEKAVDGVGSLDISDKDKKRQTRGGRGKIKLPKKKSAPKLVQISRTQRNKKKYVTIVTGLSTFDIDPKKAAKAFAQRFSCGASVSGDDEISIQGDVTYDLWDFIPEHWKEVDEDSIEDLGDVKR